jgi:predicted membrane-bound spermidine synthase
MKSRVWPVAGLKFLSGLCALVFQVAWLREFRLVFGASTPASAAVLAIFMGGLGLGNAVLGRRADASGRPLRMYALLELFISLTSFATPFVIDLARMLYVALGGQQTLGLSGATVVRLLLAALVLFVPTLLMGGTLPAASRAVTASDDDRRRSVGLLYGCNTLGAVVGASLSTFVLLEALGTRTTLWSACGLNLVTALSAWWLSAGEERSEVRGQRSEPKSPSLGKEKQRQPDAAGFSRSLLLLYVVAGLVGFAFFLMELVWYRMLTPILGGTTFTFGLILAIALSGIGIGGALYPVWSRRRVPTLFDLALSCALEGLAIAVPFAIGDRLAVLAAVLQDLTWFGFSGQVAAWSVIGLVVIFPAALISGLQFPLLIALIGQGDKNIGKQVGNAFAFNTVGAMAGSLAGGFGLMPLLTATGSWGLVVVLLVGLGAVAWLAAVRQGYNAQRHGNGMNSVLRGMVAPIVAGAAALACLLAVGPTAVWRHSGLGAGRAQLPPANVNAMRNWQNRMRRMTVWEADGIESSVALVAADSYSFYVNGKSDGNARQDANTQIMLGMLGAILHPEPKAAAVVGLGSGESAGWLAATPGIERVDVIELEPAMDEVARRCRPLNHSVLSLPNVRRILNDAREVLLTTRDRYDLIVSEPSNPYRAGIASLYTREFYAAVQQRLNRGGLFVQWLQAYEVDGQTVRTVLGTLHDAFGHVEIWRSAGTDMLLVCSQQPFVHDVPRLRRRVAESHVRSALKLAWHTDSLEGVFGFFVAGERFVAQVAQQEQRRNSDDHNWLEYGFARSVGQSAGNLIESILAAAGAGGMERPELAGGMIDWDRADAERRAFLVLSNESGLLQSTPPRTDGQRRRAEPIALVIDGNSAGAVARWSEFAPAEFSASELLLYAAAAADLADERAPDLIERVRQFHVLEADALSAVYFQRQGKTIESAEMLCRLFVFLRDDPTPHPFTIRPCLLLVGAVARTQPETAPLLYEALGQPLSVMGYEELRLGTTAEVASILVPKAAVGVIEAFEPNVPWNYEFLSLRARVYRELNHPRAEAARRDLSDFVSYAPDQQVLDVAAN